MSVDLEDWYTSGHLKDYVTKEQCIPRIEAATYPILDLFERKGVFATFFILGSIAHRHPGLIKAIHTRGHELASHSFGHTPLYQKGYNNFRKEIRETNKILEDISGVKVKGFRAPYASLNQNTAWALDILEEEAFVYDSSIFPMQTPLYGVPGAPHHIYKISSNAICSHNPDATLTEIPFTVFQSGPVNIPCTGGIYGRYLPLPVLRFLLRRVTLERQINFYFHPWETDNGIPRIDVPLKNRLVAYYNIQGYLKKIDILTDVFKFSSFERILAEQAIPYQPSAV